MARVDRKYLSDETRRLRTALRRAGLAKECVIIAASYAGYPDKKLSVVLRRIGPEEADLPERVSAALDGVPFEFDDAPSARPRRTIEGMDDSS